MKNPFTSGTGLERVYYRVGLWAALFFSLLFDKDLGVLYGLMIVGDFMYRSMDLHISFPMRASNVAKDVVYGVLGLGIFFGLSSLIMKALTPTQSVFELWSAGTPILANNVIMTYLGWGLFAATVETNFVARSLDAIEGLFGQISAHKFTFALILTMVFVAGAMTILHFQSKALQSKPLLMTFLFFSIQAFLIIKTRSSVPAILMHVANNMLAVAVSFGHLSL